MQAYADTILTGHIVTLDEVGTEVEAMAVAEGKVLSTGSLQAMRELRGPHTVVRDFLGATIVPGFNDSHAHVDTIGTRQLRPTLEGVRSIVDVLDRIRDLIAGLPKGAWLVTMPIGEPPHYFDGPSVLAERRLPNRYELDSVSPHNPVYICAPGGYWGEPICHSAMNSQALVRNGVDRNTSSPTSNIDILKDESGEPLGIFVERGYLNLLEPCLLPAVPRFTYEQRAEGIRKAIDLYHRAGTTSVYEGHGSAPEVISAYREMHERGDLTLRTSMVISPRWRGLEDAAVLMRDWACHARGKGVGDEMFRISGIFISHEGDPHAAQLQQRDLTRMGWSGYSQIAHSTEEFEMLCGLAAQQDLRVHTIAGARLTPVLAALQRVAEKYPIGSRRWVLEHVGRCSKADLDAIAQLGVSVTLIPTHYLWKYCKPFLALSGEELGFLSPARQLYEAGVKVSVGTDAAPYNPLFSMWSMTTRRERVTGRVMGEAGRVSNEVALRLMTQAGAWLSFDEQIKGQLKPGMLADIAVLSGDALQARNDELRDTRCLATMVGGRWVHDIA